MIYLQPFATQPPQVLVPNDELVMDHDVDNGKSLTQLHQEGRSLLCDNERQLLCGPVV